jgi:hypothetical protein
VVELLHTADELPNSFVESDEEHRTTILCKPGLHWRDTHAGRHSVAQGDALERVLTLFSIFFMEVSVVRGYLMTL